MRQRAVVLDAILLLLIAFAAVVAVAPRLLAHSSPRLLVGDLLPWIGIAVAWTRRVWIARSRSPLLWALPSDVFRDALVVGGLAVVLVRIGAFVEATADRPLTIAAALMVEDLIYDLGLIALAALGGFAVSRTVLRPTLSREPAPASARDISLRTRFLVIATGTSFATAGVLLDVLVDFERTSEYLLASYLALAAALVGVAALIGWLVGDDTARGVTGIAVRLREMTHAPRERDAVPLFAADEIGALALAAIDLERRLSGDAAREAAAAERERIARELHDGVAKSVSVLALAAATAAARAPEPIGPDLTRIQRLARLLSEELRAIVTDVRVHDDPRPFADTIRSLIARYPTADAELAGDLERLGTLARFELSRIVDEALANTERHSGAKHVHVRIAVTGERASVDVEDDGVGVEGLRWEDLGRNARYGLLGMRERVAILDGALDLTTGPKGGTRLHVDVPLPLS